MQPIPDKHLQALLGDLESDRVERKREWTGSPAEKTRQAVCAFANDLPNHQQPGISSYRNPHVAEAMRVLGLFQRFGVGITIAQGALRKNGNPPAVFDVQPSFIFAKLYAAR